MSGPVDELPHEALASLPDRPGEPVFDEPWQARIFALVTRLSVDGHCSWNDFKELLIDEVRVNGADDGSDYYQRWLAAAERLVENLGLAEGEALAARKEHLARHPPHPTQAASGPVLVDPPVRRQEPGRAMEARDDGQRPDRTEP